MRRPAYDNEVSVDGVLDAGTTPEHLRLLARVARLYYERDLTQQQIADQLGLSQARVSRLLKESADRGIVRSVVVLPDGVHTELEEALQDMYGLQDAVVVDADGAADVGRALGRAAASYLDVSLVGADVIGISSWSGTLVAAVEAMRPRVQPGARQVVQMFGGMGDPTVQVQATRLTGRLAEVLRAQPVYVPTPAIVGSSATRIAMESDPSMEAVVAAWRDITVSLVGVGSIEPSELLRSSGNALADAQSEQLRASGAVGDVCLRYFDSSGTWVPSGVDDRLMGMSAPALQAVPRRVAVAGGLAKVAAIRGALLGGWVSVLITDADVAAALVSA